MEATGERGRCLGLGRPRPSFSESEECRRVSVYAKCDGAAGTMRSLHCHHQASQASELSPNFGHYCNNMLLDDVGDCISGADETAHSTNTE
ncbi:uncharacterized protein [Arachis hypogaea]|uniref:uncharacterized protein isoform X1 n=1 Tax=Arachis hypogaea TaxID=3818 RepID=UPI000DECCF1F|nr:uncharacterized protein LOC112790403 isoform X1 [Arachis hypogaea]